MSRQPGPAISVEEMGGAARHDAAARSPRWLPAPGFARMAFLFLAGLLLALKLVAIWHFRADSDEPQHAHVVWGWANGQLQYRDLFDNHMPLFQMAIAPFFKLLGERADILVPLRLAMLPLYLLCLWCVYRLAEGLFSSRIAPWACLCAGAVPRFFYTSTEFRTDDLWAALWLLCLAIVATGQFTLKRAFAFGVVLGLAVAVSLKTVILVAALGLAAAIAFALGWKAIPWRRLPLYCIVILFATALAPAAIVLYFYARGAFWNMVYCVVTHNMVPGGKGLGRFSLEQWRLPASLPFLIAYGWLAYRQSKSSPLGIRRVIILLTPCIYYILLVSYWPNVTREDDLPYTPLLPLVPIPIFLLIRHLWPEPRAERMFWSRFLPAVCLLEIIGIWHMHNLREDRLRVIIDNIGDVLKLTQPGDYVMDTKSGYIFRPRPYYWVLEPMTKARIRLGKIRDNLPLRLEQRAVKVCYLQSAYAGTPDAAFIVSNYLPVDPRALNVGVAGKWIGDTPTGGTFDFDVAIPVRYAVYNDSGELAGELDGKAYAGPVALAAGRHQFHRTSGAGRVAIVLAEAIEKGFHPLPDASTTKKEVDVSRAGETQ